MAAKRRRKGLHPVIAILLCLLAAGAAAGWNYISYIKTKYGGDHPYWSRQAFAQLDRESIEYKTASAVLPADTLAALTRTRRITEPRLRSFLPKRKNRKKAFISSMSLRERMRGLCWWCRIRMISRL